MFEVSHQSAQEKPLVSVIIPAYNAEDCLTRAVESALQQSLSNIEVIVVDDASSDGTLSVARDLAEKDPRVTVIAQPENAGASAARNAGIDIAKGEWVCPLDADDWFSPTRLSTLLDSEQAPLADLLADDYYLIDHESLEPMTTFAKLNGDTYVEPIQISPSFFVEETNTALAAASDPGYLKPLMRLDFLNKHGIRYGKDFAVNHDFFIYLDCLIAGGSFLFYPDPHYFYLIAPVSLSRGNNEGKVDRLRHSIAGVEERLQDERVKADVKLSLALSEKLIDYKQLFQYHSVANAIDHNHYVQASLRALKNPSVFRLFLKFFSFHKIRRFLPS